VALRVALIAALSLGTADLVRPATASAQARADVAATRAPASVEAPEVDTPPRVATADPQWTQLRSRHDVVLGWAPRYRLEVATDPLGLEQQLWRRVDMLPLYHRVSAAGAFRIDETTSLAIHFAGWGSINLLEDAGGGLGAGDVAIGFLELEHRSESFGSISAWTGRRFLPYGPPGGLHVDGIGVGARANVGIFVEAFVGRPVTPSFGSLAGPRTDFGDATIAYAARVGYSEPGAIAASASYAEIWSHGILGSRTIDLASHWDPGPLVVQGGVKLDVAQVGLVQARIGLAVPIAREVSLDADYLHLEPGRWIPSWSILSVFETSTFDELSIGGTVRPVRSLAVRAEVAGRLYTNELPGGPRPGYRADVSARLAPSVGDRTALRVLFSRRGDGVLDYSVVQAGTAIALLEELAVSIDGALALDDAGGRLSAIGRASVDVVPGEHWTIGGTLALAHTPFAEAELRAMLRARWAPELR
jgi:hypothetical protein